MPALRQNRATAKPEPGTAPAPRKPFLKWAGGKYRVLDRILPELPAGSRFVEPFAGSCAVYLNVSFQSALVCDANQDLIHLYQHIQREGKNFIAYCQSLFTPDTNTKEQYIKFRAEFNSSAAPRRRAALLVYLNRHSFNGLVRYNAKGQFNVPFGQYKAPYFPLAEMTDFFHKTREMKTDFVCRDFRDVFASLRRDDVVYCDPPYVPLSGTARFTSYAGREFSLDDQRDLAALARSARGRHIRVLISNHDTQVTRALYADARIRAFTVQRFISCQGSTRGAAPELLALYR
ncbi:MAG: Dam family site-specific DNA-(adenine-N6)-methyltransferase [Desulfovibrionaceae bacterium]|nr:Dam family site-specific DNA-(adenine-N6)-methyltransferase [Desulfovibrionaceae bacterium]